MFQYEGCEEALRASAKDKRLLLCLMLGSPRPFPPAVADYFTYDDSRGLARPMPESLQMASEPGRPACAPTDRRYAHDSSFSSLILRASNIATLAY
mmetsp:Transcript_29496/g.90261  ORF Transcript_29496/g.90261 Transcript_29496/m.90261 type:complete len:96 (-) Transcript_29496:2919-3206(-)